MALIPDPNLNVTSDITARAQALQNRLRSMQQTDASNQQGYIDAYAKAAAYKRQQYEQQQAQQRAQQMQSQQRYLAPPGQRPTGELGGWIAQALRATGLGNEYASGIANMIRHESGGNPNAINKWDSNWKAGHPSMGLMQTIQPTFQRWALPGYNKSAYDPVSNIIAGIRYAQHRYGNDMLRSGGRRNASGGYIGY